METATQSRISVSRHVFGCRPGYGYSTLAVSPRIDPQERADLERLSFGQTNDDAFLNSLGTSLSCWCRPLKSGRYAVTRVLKGPPDDKGRATLLLITVVVRTEDWVSGLRADVKPLLRAAELWKWNGQPALPEVAVAVPPRPDSVLAQPQRSLVLALLRSVEALHAQQDVSLVLSEKDCPLNLLTLIPTLLPDHVKPTFSFAVRSLSDGLDVRLNCLAGVASRGRSVRRTVRFEPQARVADSPYTDDLEARWEPSLPPPWDFISTCRYFQSRPVKPAPRAPVRAAEPEPLLLPEIEVFPQEVVEIPDRPIRRRPTRGRAVALIMGIAAMLALLAVGAWFAVPRVRAFRAALPKQLASLIGKQPKSREGTAASSQPSPAAGDTQQPHPASTPSEPPSGHPLATNRGLAQKGGQRENNTHPTPEPTTPKRSAAAQASSGQPLPAGSSSQPAAKPEGGSVALISPSGVQTTLPTPSPTARPAPVTDGSIAAGGDMRADDKRTPDHVSQAIKPRLPDSGESRIGRQGSSPSIAGGSEGTGSATVPKVPTVKGQVQSFLTDYRIERGSFSIRCLDMQASAQAQGLLSRLGEPKKPDPSKAEAAELRRQLQDWLARAKEAKEEHQRVQQRLGEAKGLAESSADSSRFRPLIGAVQEWFKCCDDDLESRKAFGGVLKLRFERLPSGQDSGELVWMLHNIRKGLVAWACTERKSFDDVTGRIEKKLNDKQQDYLLEVRHEADKSLQGIGQGKPAQGVQELEIHLRKPAGVPEPSTKPGEVQELRLRPKIGERAPGGNP